jgi:hypothetical protein
MGRNGSYRGRGGRNNAGRFAAAGIVALLALSQAAVPLASAKAPEDSRGFAAGHGRLMPLVHRGSTTGAEAARRSHDERGRRSKDLPLRSPRAGRPIGRPLTPSQLPGGRVSTSDSPRTATPLVVSSFPVPVHYNGIAQAEACSCEPPDPWVAVSPSYVIQSTNNLIRISNRAGTAISSLYDWALFDIPVWQFGADARILWDAYHGRWVAVDLSTNADLSFANNYINLAISETADPLGVWDEFFFDFGNILPDYPGIASSTDKIVISQNEFSGAASFFDGASLLILDWSQLVNPGTFTSLWYTGPAGGIAHVRPAQLLTPSPTVHLIWEDITVGHVGEVGYEKVTGSVAADTIDFTDFTNLTTGLGAVEFTAPPPPRQSGNPATIADAVDERPTDAVWRNNQLWWVSTMGIDAGTEIVDAFVAQNVTTTAASPTNWTQFAKYADGEDRFMGGIGLAGNGDLVVTYSLSSPSTFVSSAVAGRSGTYGDQDEFLLDEGSATYGGTRWGDYVGVAADPVASSAVWLPSQTAADDGTWQTSIARVVSHDITAPTSPSSPPRPALVAPSSFPTFTEPVRISWGASTDAGSGIARYELSTNAAGSGFDPPATVTSTSVIRSLEVGVSYQFRVRAVDVVGNASAWVTGPTFTPAVKQQTSATFTTGWSSSTSSRYSGGSVRYSSTAGRYAQFTFTARAVAFVTTKGSSRGSVIIYVDGVRKATVSTFRSSTLYRQVVYQFSWSTAGSHKIRFVVVGTSGHPRVDVDAILYLT